MISMTMTRTPFPDTTLPMKTSMLAILTLPVFAERSEIPV